MCSRIASLGWFRTPKRSGPTAKPSRSSRWHEAHSRRKTARPRGVGLQRDHVLYSSYTFARSAGTAPNSVSARLRISAFWLCVSCRRRCASIAPTGTLPASRAESRPGMCSGCETTADEHLVAEGRGVRREPARRKQHRRYAAVALRTQSAHGRDLKGGRLPSRSTSRSRDSPAWSKSANASRPTAVRRRSSGCLESSGQFRHRGDEGADVGRRRLILAGQMRTGRPLDSSSPGGPAPTRPTR